MEIRLILMCSVILLPLSSVICGLSDRNSGIDDWMKTEVVHPNTWKFGLTDNSETEDTGNQEKIDSLMRSNKKIVGMLSGLHRKFNRILETNDLKNERSLGNNHFDSLDGWHILHKLNNIRKYIISSCKLDHQTTEPDLMDSYQSSDIENFIAAIDREIKNCRSINEVPENSLETNSMLKSVKYDNYGIPNQYIQEKESNSIPYPDIPCNTNRLLYTSNNRRKTSDIKRSNERLYRNVQGNTKEVTYSEVRRDISKVTKEPKKHSCHELNTKTRRNGIYEFGSPDEQISNEAGRLFYKQYCEFNTEGAAWTVIQRRFARDDQEHFKRPSSEYRLGFGELDKEFWFGNDFIHKLTSDEDMELRIVLEDNIERKAWVEYRTFKVGPEKSNYNLTIGDYRGSISDDFVVENVQDFLTTDRQINNNNELSCGATHGSGLWWLDNCMYLPRGYNGVVWKKFLERISLKSTKLMVRPKRLRNHQNSRGKKYT